MKKIVLLLSTFLIALAFPAISSAETLINLSKPSTELADGRFINNDLALALSPGGDLDALLSKPARGARTWVIDPALLEEISALGDGYTYLDSEGGEVVVGEFAIANDWLTLLRFLTRNDRVVATTYGSPSFSYLSRIAPGELAIYNQLSALRLRDFFGREVVAPGSGSAGEPAVVARNSYNSMRKTMRVLNSLVTTNDVETLRLGLAKTLNPSLSRENAVLLTKSYQNEVKRFEKRMRVSSGNYTITASRYELPLTVINDFDQQVSVDLEITTTNSRVLVDQVPRITIDPRSQLQIKVPINVIASGDTALRIQIRTPKGSAIGDAERIPLRLAVISPVTTWFTTGMAIILLLAAVIQSVRRVKRRKNHE
jgi:hypothetical protein